MLSDLKNNADLEISIVQDVVSSIYGQLGTYPAEKTIKIRQYAYATAVTRLYAIFESFVEKTLATYLDYLSENKSFESLPESIKNEYRIGFSHVLSRIDQTRFKALSHESLIEKYHKAITNEIKYQFVSEALIRHDNNLRPNVIHSLFSRLDMKNFDSWLISSAENRDVFPEVEKIKEQFESELNNFIEFRNDSSHGIPDEIGSQSTIEKHCKLVSFAINAISSFLESEILSLLISSGQALKIGSISEVYKKANAAVLKANCGSFLNVGCYVYFKSKGEFYTQKINSIRINDEDFSEYWAKSDDIEIGFTCEKIPQLKSDVFIII